MLRILELRLDYVLYLGGLAPSRCSCKAVYCTWSCSFDGKKFNIPSYEVKEGDTVELKTAKLAPSEKFFSSPEWMESKGTTVRVSRLPIRDEMDEGIHENLIIEYYSR